MSPARSMLSATLVAMIPFMSTAVMWELGEDGQTCTEACTTGCVENKSVWPKTMEEFKEIVKEAHVDCNKYLEGGDKFDPSMSQGDCAFKQLKGVDWEYCSLTPPPATARFCPCKGEPLMEDYNCTAGTTHWLRGWSQPKQKWCCGHYNTGCPQIEHINGTMTIAAKDPAKFVDVVGRDVAMAKTIATKAKVPATDVMMALKLDHAAVHKMLRHPSSEPRDNVNLQFSIRFWSNASYVPDIADVSAAEWTKLFRESLKLDTFSVTSIGREYSDLEFHNCSAGYANWELGWSDNKKAWCCHMTGLSCPKKEEPDCAVSDENKPEEWSASKKELCCAAKEVGCEAENEVAPMMNRKLMALLIIAVLACCIVLIIAMRAKSQAEEKRTPKIDSRPSSSALLMSAPEATVGIDVNQDGRADMLVTGTDADRDGIPDALEQAAREAELERERKAAEELALLAALEKARELREAARKAEREAREAKEAARKAEEDARKAAEEEEEERKRMAEEAERKRNEDEAAKKKGCCACGGGSVSEPSPAGFR